MLFNIITIFPKIFSAEGGPASNGDFCGYFSASIIKRAIEKKLIEIIVHDLRDYAKDKHKTVDDTPYGGGAGMVMKIEPIYKAVMALKSKITNPKLQINPKSKISKLKSRIILFSAKGKKYTQADAARLSKYDNLILICGRYEGVDERVADHIADEEISIGNYILTGGEIPALVLVDSVTRLLPGVLGNPESLKEESFSEKIQDSLLEYPQYTKPEEFFAPGGKGWKVPKVLLSGNHREIKKWRWKNSKFKNINHK